MNVCPTIMFSTEVPGIGFQSAETFSPAFRRVVEPIYYSKNLLWSVRRPDLSGLPFVRMLLDMFGLVAKQFKIFWSVVTSVSIFVMYSFIGKKRTSECLLHYNAMLQNAFCSYVNSNIPRLSDTRDSFFKVRPIRRYVEIPVSEKARPMHLANLAFGLFEDVSASWNGTYLSKHFDIITSR